MMTQLEADELILYQVYADSYMLSKLNSLEKSAFNMNQQYLELK